MEMLIGGRRRAASDGETVEVTNPASGEVVDTIPLATEEDVSEAIACASAGQRRWAACPLYRRAAILRRFVAGIDAHIEELAMLQSKEMGKPIRESTGDFASLKMLFNGYVEAADNMFGRTMPMGVQEGMERDFEFTVYEPLGVIACIISFNAPLVLFSHKVAPALIAGNSVIVKPASDDPLTLLRIGELLWEAGVPGDVLQFVTGSGSKIGRLLTSDPRIDKISFTGSTEVGIEIAKACAKNLTHVSLELGGNAPFVIMEDADIDRAVTEAVSRRAAYVTGQICNAAKRFIVHRTRKDEFRDKLVARLRELKIGNPQDPETQVGTLISEKAAMEVEHQVDITVSQGAKLVYGGQRSGAFYIPAVLDDVTADMDIAHDMEVFGPVFPLITFDTLDEAITLSNDTMYGLGAGIMTKDMSVAMRYAMSAQSGSVIINGQSAYRSGQMSFGGYKKSGIGREGYTAALLEMTQSKSIVFKNMIP